ncbi:hypothetical protein ABPG72_012899 [Tetrahymena utriculariae]
MLNTNFDRSYIIKTKNLKTLLIASVLLDEIVEYIQIQYFTFAEILAMCNSTLAVLMWIGLIAKNDSSYLINQEFFILFLQNLYQGTYQRILRKSKVLIDEQKSSIFDQQQVQKEITQTEIDKVEDGFENEVIENNLPIGFPNLESCYSDSSKLFNMLNQNQQKSQKYLYSFNFKKIIKYKLFLVLALHILSNKLIFQKKKKNLKLILQFKILFAQKMIFNKAFKKKIEIITKIFINLALTFLRTKQFKHQKKIYFSLILRFSSTVNKIFLI